jgi:phosphate transport system permease protein
MESIFKKLSLASATIILLLLTSIFLVLFMYAKPAMDEFGIKFLKDPRWGVSVEVQTPKTTTKINQNQSTQAQATTQPSNTNPSVGDLGDSGMPGDNLGDDGVPNGLSGLGDDDVNTMNMGGGNDENNNVTTKEIYGGLVPIVGTILSTFLAMFLAVPIAMGIAVFLSEIAPPFLSKPVGIAIELLAAIPSIIYGMWGLFYFGPLVSNMMGGSSVSLLVAGMVLAVMVIPFMASLTRDSMNTTPSILKESAYAMGATKFEVIKDVIFPYAKKGIIGSIILALGRALGETMAVAFVIGGVFSFPHKLTDPTVSIPVVLANSFAESSGISLSALFYLALILFIISFAIISVAKFYFLRDKK